MEKSKREIPFNYTSADDAQIVRLLFGQKVWHALERLRFQRRTGRLARLLLRLMGAFFMVRRNPFVYQAFIDDKPRRDRFLDELRGDLNVVARNSTDSDELKCILAACRNYIRDLENELNGAHFFRQGVVRQLGGIIGEENICFDPFSLIGHATDATDWRLFLPVAVARPGTERQIPQLMTAIAALGLHVVPRGAGTGLTGGAVPVHDGCVMINTEKLNYIHGIETVAPDTGAPGPPVPVLHLEAGVITGDAMSYAEKNGYVFATDPTSAWACTIGGNIAENAGGKTAVLWGTAIDNIWSFRIAVPGGRYLEVRRVAHPLRRILPEDEVVFSVVDLQTDRLLRTIRLPGTAVRKKGLGKDITNKALGGLPGIQKEGTDGVITSARFILHRAYPFKSTACLEFFGDDMDEAARVICRISEAFVSSGDNALMALEHFDEEYVRAIGYKTKAPSRTTPKAVLLVDMVGKTEQEIETVRQRLGELLTPFPNTSVFFAADESEAARYWQDRKRLGAIAARTNAFKMNEDIVLPLQALAEFADYVDRYNIEEERFNQKSLVWQIGAHLETVRPLADPQWLDAKMPHAQTLLRETIDKLAYAGKGHLQAETHIRQLLDDLTHLFSGYQKVSGEIEALYAEVRAHRIVIATHMHAGDGNVHVNIPVFSNDRDMMIRAAETAEAIMAKAVELDGVVSGEHGIGFTKLNFIDRERLTELAEYRSEIDPDGLMNPGKLSDLSVPNQVYTPSFNLIGLEAQILQKASLHALADRISKCIRCGKCKADCCTFYPARNLFFHPRNKNLAIAAIVEALLFDAQRSRSTRFGFLKYLEEVADHCTICHKCFSPCPVNIDTGEISILERQVLTAHRFKKSPLVTRLTLGYLESRSPAVNAVFRRGVLRWGSYAQRSAYHIYQMVSRGAPVRRGVLSAYLSSPLTPASPKPLRAFLPDCDADQAVHLRPAGTPERTVLYFPGCGSERLFSRVGLAALYILLRSGTAVVLPPPFLCCGYPASVNAKVKLENRETLRDAIILSQIREMFGYLRFDACVVTCGTCLEALRHQAIETVYAAPLLDVSRFVVGAGMPVRLKGAYAYHRPCHDSLEGQALSVLKRIAGGSVYDTPHCCGEAGTLAFSRPDIAAAMRTRKAEALKKLKDARHVSALVTNCPSCLQGLGRQSALPFRPRHLAEIIAEALGGKNWERDLKSRVADGEVVRF